MFNSYYMALKGSDNYAAVRTELDRVFFQNFDGATTIPGIATANTASIFKPMQFDRNAHIEEIFAGSGLFSKIGEVQNVPIASPKIANKLTAVVLDYADSIEVSKDYFDDNLHGLWNRAVAEMARMALATQSSEAFGIFRGAFDTTLTADGSALCSAHTLIGGGTETNYADGAGSALSGTSLNTGIVNLAVQKNQRGVVMGLTPTVMVVPPALFTKAKQETDSALYADNANNAINVYRSVYGFEVYQSPYLSAAAGGSDTAWFLLANNHSITRLIRQGIVTALTDWHISNNRTYKYQANYREVCFASDYIGVYGAKGV